MLWYTVLRAKLGLTTAGRVSLYGSFSCRIVLHNARPLSEEIVKTPSQSTKNSERALSNPAFLSRNQFTLTEITYKIQSRRHKHNKALLIQ